MLLSSQSLWHIENSADAHILARAHRLKTSALGHVVDDFGKTDLRILMCVS